MDGMSMEEEWIASIPSKSTKRHYLKDWKLFKDFLGKTDEEILELRKEEGKRFTTRVLMFYDEQKEKGLSQNSARTKVIAIQSFFSYYDQPIKVSKKLPELSMKIESYRPSVEDLQKVYSFGDLNVKAWLSLSIDCPARIGDLLRIARRVKTSEENEFLIESQKESIVGKVYISDRTRELFSMRLTLPTSKRGIAKLLERACDTAGVHRINPHLLRKLWISTAINLGIQQTIVKILTFKAVEKSLLTYFLDRSDLRESWKKVVDALPLEAKKANGRVDTLMEATDLVLRVLRKICLKELQKEGYTTGVLGVKVDYSRLSHKEILEEYLKKIKSTENR